MHYEKAELILQQLMAGDRDLYLAKDKDGGAVITDRPNQQQQVVEKIERRRVRLLPKLVSLLLCVLCPVAICSGAETKTMYVHRCRVGPDEILEECQC